jgi:hypothetical protein
VLIERLQAGDVVTTIGPAGEVAVAAIRSVFTTTNRMWEVQTDRGTITTTETQPMCLHRGESRRAGELQPGDVLLEWSDGQLAPAMVETVTATSRTSQVFNLVLDDADVYIAGGFLARSKPPGELAAQ